MGVPTGAGARQSAAAPALSHTVEPQVFEEVFVQEEAAASSSWSPLAFGAALGLAAAVMTTNAPAASAADLENGSAIFGANCTACHANGKNNVKAEKTLFPEPLKANGRYEIPDMINWITAGGLGMPAFG